MSLTIDDRQFQKQMLVYLKTSKRTVAKGLNVKSYFIVKKALRMTRKADKKKIQRHLAWNGKNANRLRRWALKHMPKLKTDAERKKFFKKMKSARVRSVGYLKSGWIPALKAFGRITNQSKKSKGVTARGIAKGYGRWAKASISPKATFANSTGYKSGRGKGQKYSQQTALKKYGKPALGRAFQSEARSMKRYMEKKMQEATNRTGLGR